jgi:8-oxo-dGTP pyrophosphatase MutT (NUDIX family)
MTENTPQKRVADVLIIHNAYAGVDEVWQGLVTDAVRARLMARIESKVGNGAGGKPGAPMVGATSGSAALALDQAAPSQNPDPNPKRGGGTGVLLVRAKWNLNKPNSWQMPGGHVEPGETADQRAQREADEELGAGAVRVGRQLIEITEDDGTVAHVFEGHLNFDVPITVDGEEIAEYAWFAADAAAENMNPLSARLLRAAMEKLGLRVGAS